MKNLILVLILSLFSYTSLSAQTSSPCNDSLYLKLKSRGVENLSENEIAYLSQKENECRTYTNSLTVDKSKVEAANQAIVQKRNYEERERRDSRNYRLKKGTGKFISMVIIFGALLYALKKLATL